MFLIAAWIPWFPSALYFLGAALALAFSRQAWRTLALATAGGALAACVDAAIVFSSAAGPGGGSRAAAALVIGLIAFLGWVIGDYSRRYLEGEPGGARFVAAYLVTLASVSTVVMSPHFGLLIAAWMASSLGLHHLLTFYPGRAAAAIVAHKKFLASRLAELCLMAAALLLYRQFGTLDIVAIDRRAAAPSSGLAAAAAALIALAVLIKCAQLPLHGWLIQVMEAPTPVSALLHAGVVNLGGYVLIRFAPLISASPGARAMLVIAGSVTAVLAGLVMLTRITIKVRLAWSTCSQMGFMVMECGLGLYDLALLHLLAHALYKAYGFLTAGDVVRNSVALDLAPRALPERSPRSPIGPVLALVVSVAVIEISAAGWARLAPESAIPPAAVALLACGLATLLWTDGLQLRSIARRLAMLVVLVQVYFGWHRLFAATLGVASAPPSALLGAWTIAAFLVLYFAQWAATHARPRVLATRLYRWAYAGFYLDERFTALAFRLWPVRLDPRP